MIDLRNIAQQLRLPADQLRLAADLLEQGYQPAFIARYRADETGHLPGSVLWSIKFAMERELQLSTARKEALAHLGEGVELDDEGRERVERGQSIVAIDVALRCFRSRKAARQSGERTGQASQLLEKMIAAPDAISDLPTWVAEQMTIEVAQSEALLQQASRLIGTLLSGDTRLFERMRTTIQKKAVVRIEAQAEPAPKAKGDKSSTATNADGSPSDAADHEAADSAGWDHADDDMVGDHASDSSGETPEEESSAEITAEASSPETTSAEKSSAEVTTADATTPEGTVAEVSSPEGTPATDPAQPVEASATAESTAVTPTENIEANPAETISLSFEGKKNREGKLSGGKRKSEKEKEKAKAAAKLTPRQRRRRWLGSVLQPLKSLKKPIHRLTSYQMLMIGRGQRSQLIKVDLEYDRRQLINMARDVFVPDGHPLSRWFTDACEQALSAGLFAKAETDALAEEDELAQQKLLEAATDQLRTSLLQRPVKGHRVLIIDTVGPNSACIAIIDARGKCLATQEVVCSSLPSVVSQNVIMLGELVHKHKVTLVAISNGPARRFLIHTVVELMKQSVSSNLRWTMVDRGGAEAYATSRHASVELPQLNRRFRAAVWLGRRLQDPLTELLKLDTTRLRLGSFQRELPQEPLKRLVTATLSDCLCVKGVDSRYASEQQFSYVPGVTPEIAARLGEMATKREFTSREALLSAISDWPENGKRQALGFLRIYQSPQTLDGTLIHPDDYHLAERLIENSDFTQPATAPDGWLPPKIKAPKPPKHAQASTSAAFAEGLSGTPATDTGNTEPSLAVGDTPTENATGTATAPQSSSSEPVAASTEPPVASPTESVASESASESPTESPAEPALEGSAVEGSAESSESTISPAAEETSSTQLAPEYSEDVVAQQDAPETIDTEKLARGWQVGRSKLAWLANCLGNPFGDTRDNRPPVPMLTSVPTLADLQPGMSVYAIVVGVAEFGAFVELGPDCGGLIHISRLSADYVEDPHQAVQIGDLVQAWVVSVDVEKKRVALTALSPDQQQQQLEDQREADAQRQESRQAQRSQGQGRGQGGPRSGQAGQGQAGQGQAGQGQAGQGQAGQGQAGQGQAGQGHGGQRQGYQGQGQGGRPGGQGQGAGQGNRQGSGQGGGPGARRNDRGGSGGGSRPRGGAPGGRRDGGDSRPVIVKSKKPAAPITDAMKKGQEPLRSFSDLLQFYEVKRTDGPAEVNPVNQTPPPPAGNESNDSAPPSPPTEGGSEQS